MPTPNKPTLIIGLGGMGSKIVERVYLQYAATPRSGVDKRNVAFLCLDTDEADVNNRRLVMPENSVVKTSSDIAATVGGYIDSIRTTTDVLKWFDISNMHLNSMPLNKGAAQIRMASRLALMSAIREGKLAAIDNSIASLLAVEPERHQGNIIRAIIVSSLAGGTGAGSFLQTAYYVKNAMMQRGIAAPEVEGYFLLADVLCDSEKGNELNDDQKENMRSNTYACMKELMAFSKSNRGVGLKDIEFEYRLGQRDKSLPVARPYYQCYLIDYTASSGENLGKMDSYCEQVVSYLYLQAFSPEGDQHRSNAINDMRTHLRADGQNMFNALGVSKLVYPVDDLFAYFARQRVTDNMRSSWCLIDKEFEEEFSQYKKDVREGIPHTKPKIESFFMDKVFSISQDSGSQGAEFKEIYRSTQLYDEQQNHDGSKAKLYYDAVNGKIKSRIKENPELEEYAKACRQVPVNFTTQDVLENDAQTVKKIENALHDYWSKALGYVDSTKRSIASDCFMNDHDADNYVSRTPEDDPHHLNTLILQPGEEMHPLAVRYFLYDLKSQYIVPMLNRKKTANATLKQKIESYFNRDYNPETKDVRETAVQGLQHAKDKNRAIGKVITNSLSGRKPYREWKVQYVSDATAQAANIKKFIEEKLTEETFSNLLNYVNRVLEESEAFFKGLPDALEGIEKERDSLLKKHDGASEKHITYVLASSQIKKDIYDNVISANDSPFFPTVMSASLYRSMYHNAVIDLSGDKFATSKRRSPEEKKKAALEANEKIIVQCVDYQDSIIRENNRGYATKNVIAALREEAMRESFNDKGKAWTYMLQKFQNFRDQARIWGPNDVDKSIRRINAWGFHPDCIQPATLSQKEADDLFGDTNVFTNPETAASRLPSDCFSPFEIIRANSATCLSIKDNFKKFHAKERTNLLDEYYGPYYVAYKDVIDRVFMTERRTRAVVSDEEVVKEVTVHLDKHWHLPAYMPNIGSDIMDEIKKMVTALCYGLLLNHFRIVQNGGLYYWKYVGNTAKWIRNEKKEMIQVGQTIPNAISVLFEEGLVNNPEIVEEVLQFVEEEWKKALETWMDTECEEGKELETMKEHDLVKKIVEFKFKLCNLPAFTSEKNWFFILHAQQRSGLRKVLELDNNNLIKEFLKDLAEHLIGVFGQSYFTQQLCKYVLDGVSAPYDIEVEIALRELESKHRFEPEG